MLTALHHASCVTHFLMMCVCVCVFFNVEKTLKLRETGKAMCVVYRPGEHSVSEDYKIAGTIKRLSEVDLLCSYPTMMA